MLNFSLKQLRIITGSISLLSIIVAIIIGYIYKLDVCTMCYSQRASFIVIGLGLFIWHYIGKGLFVMGGISGLWLSARHTYIMYNPHKALNSCGADLSFLWEMEQYIEVIKSLMLGGIDCTKEKFSILGLYLPTWSLILFVMLSIMGSFLIWKDHVNAGTTK